MTNQASEDELTVELARLMYKLVEAHEGTIGTDVGHRALVAGHVTGFQAIIRTEKLKLLDELDKSMPTAEQLTTKYGYHMPEKQYGYKMALHDIREVLTKLEAEL